MKRSFGIISAFCLALTLSVVPAVGAPVEAEPMQNELCIPDEPAINVTVSGSTLRVVGAAKQTLTVYTLIGTKAAVYAIDTDDQTINTSLSKGVYLVKVGKFVRKVSIS